ncbi:hypothetical protein D9M69_403970 [compost metagenome]
MGIADGADVDAEQLELGRHVRAHERLGVFATQLHGDRAGHLVARRDQAEDAAVPGRAFADGMDVRVAGQALAVDRHATARAELQLALAGQRILRADAGGEHDQVGFQPLVFTISVAGEVHPVAVLAAGADRLGAARQVHADAQRLDLRLERQAAVVVQLHRHQAWGELHDMRLQAQRLQRVGRFQAEQTATDHHAATGVGGRRADAVEVGQGAIDQPRVALGAFDGRHEGIGTGGQHQAVIAEAAVGGDHFAAGAVDLQHRHAEVQGDAGALVQRRLAEGQRFGVAAGEVFGKVHAVVGAQRLLAEHVDPVAIQRAALDQLLDAVVADHAVADDDQRLQTIEVSVHKGTRSKPITFFEGKKKAPETLRFQAPLPVLSRCCAGPLCLAHRILPAAFRPLGRR